MSEYYENLSDTSDDDDHNNFSKIINNSEIKKYCDDFITGEKSMSILDKIINDNNIKDILGCDKYFIGFYCQKMLYLDRKFKSEENKIKESNICIDKKSIITL